MQDRATDPTTELIGSGVPGLDDVLGGGWLPNRMYLIEGTPGSGKTTIALQFLREGVQCGESVLYVTLSETERELRGVAQSHGWDLSGVAIREMLPSQDSLQPDEQYTMFHPSEVELSETTLKILSDVESLRPTRALEPPIVPTRPPTTTVGSRPAKLRIVAVIEVVVVLP